MLYSLEIANPRDPSIHNPLIRDPLNTDALLILPKLTLITLFVAKSIILYDLYLALVAGGCQLSMESRQSYTVLKALTALSPILTQLLALGIIFDGSKRFCQCNMEPSGG